MRNWTQRETDRDTAVVPSPWLACAQDAGYDWTPILFGRTSAKIPYVWCGPSEKLLEDVAVVFARGPQSHEQY